MPRYQHLKLVRLPERFERRKRRGFGTTSPRNPADHGQKLQGELDATIAEQRSAVPPSFVNPALILRIQMAGPAMEEEWERLGLTLLASDDDKTLVLFASGEDLGEFRKRIDVYREGPPVGQQNPSYAGFIGNVEEIGAVMPRDRIGLRFKERGVASQEDFAIDHTYTVDIELWDVGNREIRAQKVEDLAEFIVMGGGEVFDTYIGPSITMIRARSTGAIVRDLLAIPEIAGIDLPPEPDVVTGDAFMLTAHQIPELDPVDELAPTIGIIDSGVNEHPMLDGIIVGAIGVPDTLGTADDFGHGTRVAGVAVFGDLRSQIQNNEVVRLAKIASAKVVNGQGRFDERRLVPWQMREALTALNERYGCRIFVIPLGDTHLVYDGKKVGSWAATLDELARELNAVIIVSTGNRGPRSGLQLEESVTEYPHYLLEPSNRLLEPAGAINAITVGSLAQGEGVGPDAVENVHLRPITRAFEPSPFTRIGPGVGGACKPDLIELGGTMVFDPVTARLRKGEDLPTAGLLTLHHRFTDRLFTAGSGTSYSAPLLASKAAQILTQMPDASANLVRALLVGSADVPREASAKLEPLGPVAVRTICGNGRVDALRAAFSDENRVVLYAEDELEYDHFAVYELPIPDTFQTGGRRSIRVTLAFDPPVRHTRADYAGVGMSFRLVRGRSADQIFEHFRRRTQDDGDPPELEDRYNCSLSPGAQQREKNTVQTAAISFMRDTESYGDRYHIVVRCEKRWAAGLETRQRFAIVVELLHQNEVRLYERLRARVRV